MGPKELCITWGQGRTNPFNSQPREVIIWRCGFLSKFFDHLFNFGAVIMSLQWVKLGMSNLVCGLIYG